MGIKWDDVKSVVGGKVDGLLDSYLQSIDLDQIAHNDKCQYDFYILVFRNGREERVTKDEMQREVDTW